MAIIDWVIVFLSIVYAWVLLFFSRFKKNTPQHINYREKITVIVPARNEQENIVACLESIIGSGYENIRILVVDDHSVDNTADKAKTVSEVIEVVSLPHNMQGKKDAITYGVGLASTEWIAITDADCLVPNNWLYHMGNCFSPETAMVCGWIQMKHNNVFETLQAIESAGLMVLAAGSRMAGFPTMCNGANMAFRKDVFETLKGYQNTGNTPSGDDELLMHKFWKHQKGSVVFCTNTLSLVQTAAAPDLSSFIMQRIRWASKGKFYKLKTARVLQLFVGLYMLVLAFSLGLASFYPLQYAYLLWFFAVKVAVDLTLYKKALPILGFEKPAAFAPVLASLWQILYIPLVALLATKPRFEWKGREYGTR